MVQIKIGTAGWDYKDWIGSFYPKRLKRSQFLEFFSKFFEIVEINSSFYNLPSKEMVKNWNERVPESFRFIVKVWKNISHNLNDPALDSYITEFLYRFEPLKEKISGFLIQFPPWFKYSKAHLNKLTSLLEDFPLKFKLFIELRDNSWFKSEILSKFIDLDQKILSCYEFIGRRGWKWSILCFLHCLPAAEQLEIVASGSMLKVSDRHL